MWGAEDKPCWAFLSLWAEVDKNRDKLRICFPSLRLALHPAKALREQVLDCFI